MFIFIFFISFFFFRLTVFKVLYFIVFITFNFFFYFPSPTNNDNTASFTYLGFHFTNVTPAFLPCFISSFLLLQFSFFITLLHLFHCILLLPSRSSLSTDHYFPSIRMPTTYKPRPSNIRLTAFSLFLHHSNLQ